MNECESPKQRETAAGEVNRAIPQRADHKATGLDEVTAERLT